MLFSRRMTGIGDSLASLPLPERKDESLVAQPITKIELDGEELCEYTELAAKVGFLNPALLELNLKTFLRDEGICVYNTKQVEQYMKRKVRQAEKDTLDDLVYCWKPLRPVDLINAEEIGNEDEDGHIRKELYPHPVPLPVLLTVEKIVATFGSLVQFYVTDYGLKRPDPFLAVTARELPWYIIERWDEPTFRMKR